MLNKEQFCGSMPCYTFYESSTNNMTGTCSTKFADLTLDLTYFITTDESMYKKEDEDNQSEVKIAELNFILKYYCLTNNCNNRTITELIKKALKDHYDLSPMYKVLKVKINGTSTGTINATENSTTLSIIDLTSTEKTSMTTISDTTTSTIKRTTEQPNNISMSLHISMILIIFNAFLFRFF